MEGKLFNIEVLKKYSLPINTGTTVIKYIECETLVVALQSLNILSVRPLSGLTLNIFKIVPKPGWDGGKTVQYRSVEKVFASYKYWNYSH